MGQVHIAITRQVKPGNEAVFEKALRAFARDSLNEPGMTGVHLISPVPGSEGAEYGILRSFDNEAASRAFYESHLFQNWQQQVAPYVIGPPVYRRLHGLEAFFRNSRLPMPPRWKMAVVTWLGVFPTAVLWSTVLPKALDGLHTLVIMAIVNIFVVVTLAWGVMPMLTRFLARWLHANRSQALDQSSQVAEEKP